MHSTVSGHVVRAKVFSSFADAINITYEKIFYFSVLFDWLIDWISLSPFIDPHVSLSLSSYRYDLYSICYISLKMLNILNFILETKENTPHSIIDCLVNNCDIKKTF